MTISLKKLIIHDFGPYMGTQSIDLDTPDSSPVILIHGENTLGKTQLFSAIRWCLYGTLSPQQTHAQAAAMLAGRLNHRSARERGSNVFSVSLLFDVDGDSHVLTRSASLIEGGIKVSADMRIGATVVPVTGIDAEVARLLHPQISEFFLFDGELLKNFYDRLNSERERGFIKDSIEKVLGIPALQLAQNDLAALYSDALERQSKSVKQDAEAERIQKRLRLIADEMKSNAKDRDELVTDLRKAEEERERLRSDLKQVESLQADVREQETLEAQITEGDDETRQLRTQMRTLLKEGWMAAAAGPLEVAHSVIQERNNVAQGRQKDIHRKEAQLAALQERALGGECPTCGQSLPPVDALTEGEIQEVERDLEALHEDPGGNIDLQAERSVGALIDRATAARYREQQERLNGLEVLLFQRRQRLAAISDRLAGHNAAEIRTLGSRVRELDRIVDRHEEQIRLNAKAETDLNSEKQKLGGQLQKLPGARPEVANEAEYYGFVETLLSRTIQRFRDRVRWEVEEQASSMFLKLIRDPGGYNGLQIGPDYNVTLVGQHGQPRDTSEGGKQLLALSLIGALKQAAVRGGPVVLDSPLGRLDKKHRENVLQNWIPSLGSQAILLVQSGEMTQEEAHAMLGSLIGREYRVSRPDNDPEYAMIAEAR